MGTVFGRADGILGHEKRVLTVIVAIFNAFSIKVPFLGTNIDKFLIKTCDHLL
jgi:hypothetical protein